MPRGGARPGAGRKSKQEKTLERIREVIASPDPRVLAMLTGRMEDFPAIVRATLKLALSGNLAEKMPMGSDEPSEDECYFILVPDPFRGVRAIFYDEAGYKEGLKVFERWVATAERYARILDVARELEQVRK